MMAEKHYEGRQLDGSAVRVQVGGGRITAASAIADRAELPWLLPPLVDLQQNGALGVHYDHLTPETADTLETAADLLLRKGVGRVYATFNTRPYDLVCLAGQTFAGRLAQSRKLASLYFGIFHEGVFISPVDGWVGAHPKEYVRAPDWDLFRRFDEAVGGRTRVINLAPEEPGGLAFIEQAVAAGKVIALGHCCPDTATIREAVRRGASRVTHFGNGAAVQLHRHQNPFWEFLNNAGLQLGLIADGFHLPPEIIQVAFRQKGRENCYVVSDSSGKAGCPPGVYGKDGSVRMVIEANGFMHVEGQQVLAGSSCQMDTCVEVLVNRVGLTFPEAWAQCSLIPARVAGVELPRPVAGAEATFVLADWRGDRLQLQKTIFLGEEYLPVA